MGLTVYSKEQDERNNKGVWMEFEGSELRVARWLNTSFISGFLVETKSAAVSDSEDEEELSEENIEKRRSAIEQYNLMCKAMAGTILTDWKNVRNEETGEEVPFSVEVAEILLRNNVRVHNFVKTESQKLENFESKKEQAVSGE